MTATLTAISGLGPKEPAAFLVEAEGRRLLLDCGVGADGETPDLARIGRVDAVVLSHGHHDHADAVPALMERAEAPVWATPPALDKLPLSVERHVLPECGAAEIAGIRVETGRDGHAPGGVWLRLSVGEGLIYMGDHSARSGLYAFDPPPRAATVILDASYGAAEEPLEDQRRALLALAAEGPALFPVPPDGRGVEIALALLEAGFPVAIDAAVRAVAEALAGRDAASVRPEALGALTRLLAAAAPLTEDAPCAGAMVAGAANGAKGVAGALIRRWRNEARPAVVFTGHLGPASEGRRLVEGGRALFRRWNVHPTLSENAEIVRRIAPARVVPAFGEADALAALRSAFAPAETIAGPVVRLPL